MQEKEIDQNRNRNLLSKVFNLLEIFEITEQELLLDSLLSAWTFVYWNMEVLLELLIIEIIFLQSKFTQSAQLLDVFFKSVQWAGAGWYVADSAFLLPELSRHDSSFCIPAPVLSGQESRQLFLFKTKLIIYLCILQFENL